MQRRFLRFILSMGPRDHLGSRELKLLNWLSVTDRLKYFSLIHVFKIRSGIAPGYLSQFFVQVKSNHSQGTRGTAYNYQLSKNLSLAPTCFSFSAIKDWNALPASLKGEKSLNVFCGKLKQHLMLDY